jgi:hypothetical protein
MKKSTRWGLAACVLIIIGYLAAAHADELAEDELLSREAQPR